MPEHLHYEEDDLFNRETHHEKSDVPIKPLFWFIAICVGFGFVTHFALWAMYRKLVDVEKKNSGPDITSMAKPADMNVPRNQPLLQPFPRKQGAEEIAPNRNTPVTDLADMRRAEDEVLTTFGWVDRQKGVVRVPIDVAKTLALQRLNAAPAPAATTAAPTTTGGAQ